MVAFACVTLFYILSSLCIFYFILDFINGGELFTHLYIQGRFSEKDTRIYAAEITLALETLHKVSDYSSTVPIVPWVWHTLS